MSHPIPKLQFDGGDIGNVGVAAHLEFRKEFLLLGGGTESIVLIPILFCMITQKTYVVRFLLKSRCEAACKMRLRICPDRKRSIEFSAVTS